MSDKQYIEDGWRNAKFEDLAAGAVLNVRFANNDSTVWTTGTLYGFRYSSISPYFNGVTFKERCQIYEQPDPGEGYELAVPSKGDDIADYQYWGKNTGQWLDYMHGSVLINNKFHRRKILSVLNRDMHAWASRRQVSTSAYTAICKYYGDKRAKRSGVLYMNHIDEGLDLLSMLGANTPTRDAYCIHPILQDDETLAKNIDLVLHLDPRVLILAMEYRNVANRGLHCYQVDDPNKIYQSPLKEVSRMLIADKVQNRKDFELYHKGTHPKSAELDRYFRNWLRALGVTEEKYQHYVSILKGE